MSPRTKVVHVGQNLSTLGTVSLVVHELTRFGAHLFSATQTNGVHESLANRLRRRSETLIRLGRYLGIPFDKTPTAEVANPVLSAEKVAINPA